MPERLIVIENLQNDNDLVGCRLNITAGGATSRRFKHHVSQQKPHQYLYSSSHRNLRIMSLAKRKSGKKGTVETMYMPRFQRKVGGWGTIKIY